MYLGQLHDSYQLSLFICNFLESLFSYGFDNIINDNCRNYFVFLIAIKKLHAVTRKKKSKTNYYTSVIFRYINDGRRRVYFLSWIEVFTKDDRG